MTTNRQRTLEDYRKRIAAVVAHIHDHLDDRLDMERLAAVASFSPFHWHRIYRAMTGETAAHTVRRLRLQRAAEELMRNGSEEIGTIAARAGYASGEAFARAFRRNFGVSPSKFRLRFPPSDAGADARKRNTATWQVDIRRFEPMRLATIRHVGPYREIGRSFDHLHVWASATGRLGPRSLAVAVHHDDPDLVAAEDLRCDAGLLVESGFAGDDMIGVSEVAGGRHAVLHHVGPYAGLERAYHWLFGFWLPRSGEIPADRPVFDIYLDNPKTVAAEHLRTEICLPLAEVES